MGYLGRLFEPGKIGKVTVRNRIVMPAMQTRAADDEGYVTDRLVRYYARRAQGGAGMIIVQQSFAWSEARLNRGLGVWDDKFIPGLRDLSSAIRAYGASAAVQLGARGTNNDRGIPGIAPSALPTAHHPETIPHELSKEEIDVLVEAFSEAARRVKDAGFDAVEIHGAHGHLISQFLSPHTNRRTDEYGGSTENRTRFARRIIARTREKAGGDFPIMFRMSADDFLEGGTTLEDALIQASLFVAAGADCLDVSGSTHDTNWRHQPSYLSPPTPLVHLAQAVKRVVSVPVVTAGRLGDPVVAEQILEKGKADFIAMGRALVADPYLPNKAKEQRFEDIRHCMYCMGCLASNSVFGDLSSGARSEKSRLREVGFACTVNPTVLRERETELKPASVAKKIVVVGGGLAGMEMAVASAKRGHIVSLYEKSPLLGGQWRIASLQPGKGHFAKVIERLQREMERAGVEVHLNKEVTKDFIAALKPDAVVVATGAVPMTLPVPGGQGKNVVQAIDVIQGVASAGDRVVVVGGRHIGIEVAADLAEKGKKVYLVTRGQFGRDVQRHIRTVLRDRLVELGVSFFSYCPVLEIKPDSIFVSHEHSLLILKADTVVLAVGAQPVHDLFHELQGTVSELYSIGDCREPRDAMEAIYEGFELGRTI